MSTSEKHSEEDKNKWERDLRAQEERAKVRHTFSFPQRKSYSVFTSLPRTVMQTS